MNNPNAVEKCKTFINCQLKDRHNADIENLDANRRPTITLSRQAGAGAVTVAEHLSRFLNEHDTSAPCPWTIFDKNLVQTVLEDHHLPKQLERYLPEDRISEIGSAVRELLGVQPPLWTLVHYTTDTILRLAQLGNVILVGRAAPVITGNLKNAFHARLVGSLDKRVNHVREFYQMSHTQALDFVNDEDRNRARYLKTYFGRDIDDPMLYHLTINTDIVSYEEAARIIGESILRRLPKSNTANASP